MQDWDNTHLGSRGGSGRVCQAAPLRPSTLPVAFGIALLGVIACAEDSEPTGAVDGAADSSSRQPVGCVTEVAAGKTELSCEGITYLVSAPEECLDQACGLIVDVHGGTMSAQMQDNNTDLARLGNENGFVVVHPSAPGGLWAADTHDALVVGFIEDAIEAYGIDEHRVHMTGFSQGGFMTWRLLCSHTELFASVAPGAAAGTGNISPEVGCTFTGDDVPSAPRDVLYLHGHSDALVNFTHWAVLLENVTDVWSLSKGRVAMDGKGYTRTRYAAPGGQALEFIEHDYAATSFILGGHCYPGSDDQSPQEPGQLMGFGCVGPNGFHWGEEVVQFFLDHPRP